MHRKRVLRSALALLLAVASVAAGVAAAQSPEGTEPEAVLANLGTAFTYQGRLVDDSIPAAGVYDFQFRLYDAAGGGAQIGGAQSVADVAVSGGLFTVTLDFGAGAFNGLARWLEIDVKRDADAGYTTLSPRVALSPAPHALALPGLWTQQNATSPNLIGGYSGNSVSVGVVGATIGGGGAYGGGNSVTANYGTVGGGYYNTASDVYGTVGGGYYNTASGGLTTVGGGFYNTASDDYATVGGGYLNTASDANATVGGGTTNTASDAYATVSGGQNNTASWINATVSGGYYNTASSMAATVSGGQLNMATGANSTVGGGYDNTASGSVTTVGGGAYNTASGHHATVPGGEYGVASHWSELAYAGGRFAADGDAQTSLYVLRRETENETLTELFLDGIDDRITLAADRVMTFDILVVGSHRFGGGSSAGYQVAGVIRNIGGATSFVGTPVTTVLGENVAGWDVQVEASDALDALVVKVQGSSATSVRWVASVRTVEVGR